MSKCVVRPVSAGAREVRADVALPCGETSVFFRVISEGHASLEFAWTPEAQIALGLMPAMKAGIPLVVEGRADPLFINNMATAQQILKCWNPNWSVVPIDPTEVHEGHPLGTGRQALFFTGGVDSFYSLLRHRETITDLVYIHGFDIGLRDTKLRQAVSAYLQRVAADFDINLIELESNIRELLDKHASWLITHGGALAVAGHLMAGSISRFLFSSGYSYLKLLPLGTHPLLDPLWSNSNVRFAHIGAEAPRAQKVELIATNPLARRHLRVCWRRPKPRSLNCGRCEKCLRTMVALRAADKLYADEAFSVELTLLDVTKLRLDEEVKALWEENLNLLAATGNDPQLQSAVEQLLEAKPNRLIVKLREMNRRRLDKRRAARRRARSTSA